jgi:hypothetical protein
MAVMLPVYDAARFLVQGKGLREIRGDSKNLTQAE